MGHRRKAREYALQGLYMYEIGKKELGEIRTLDWLNKEIPDDIRDFAVTLITKSVENITYIDELIKTHSTNWTLERFGAVDKAILRLSVSALLYMQDIPAAVTINEAIELGKIYGGENTGQFINGILDAIKKSIAKEDSSDGEH